MRWHGIVDGTRNRGNGRLMEDDIRPADDRSDLVVTSDVHPLQIDRCSNFFQILLAAAEEIIDHDHSSGSLPQQAAHQSRPDKPGAPRYHVFAHDVSSDIRDS